MHKLNKTLNRREFIKTLLAVSGVSAFTAFLNACRAKKAGETFFPVMTTKTYPPAKQSKTPTQARPTASQDEGKPLLETAPVTQEVKMSRVAFVRTKDREQGVRLAIEVLGALDLVGKSVFLKPNLNSADPTPGSTHLQVLRTLVQMLQLSGAERITLGDRSGMGDTRQVMRKLGVLELADSMGFNTLVLDELPAEDWVAFTPPHIHWEKGFPVARPCLEADALIQTCCLKTHRFGGHFTLSLKNSVGMVAKRVPGDGHDYMRELHTSPYQRKMIAEINLAYQPSLVVLDGVEAFISGGPDKGERVAPHVILAGKDRVAIDVIGVALLRYFGCRTEASKGGIFAQEQIARAVELSLGVDSPEKIEFLTPDAESENFARAIRDLLHTQA